MKKFLIISSIISLLLVLTVGTMIIYGKKVSQQNYHDFAISNQTVQQKNAQYQYKPIPKEKQAEYKAEVEKYIDEQVPIAIQEVEQIREDSHNFYLNVLKDKKLYIDYTSSNFDIIISTGEFNLLSKIIDITDKYVKIKDEEALATDYNGAVLDFLSPYFVDNNINTEKLDKLGVFINKKRTEIIQEQEFLHKIIYPNENY